MPNEQRRGLMGYAAQLPDYRDRPGLMRRLGNLGDPRQLLDVATELVPGLRGLDLYDSQTGQTMAGRWMQRGHNFLNRNRSMYPQQLEDWQRAQDPGESSAPAQSGGPGGAAQRPTVTGLPPIQPPQQAGLRSRVGPGRGQTVATGAGAQAIVEGMRGPTTAMRETGQQARAAMARMFEDEER